MLLGRKKEKQQSTGPANYLLAQWVPCAYSLLMTNATQIKTAEKKLTILLGRIDRALDKGKDCSELHRLADEATLWLASLRG